MQQTLLPSPVDNLETEHAMMQLVEDMCLHKMAGQLYSNLQQECDAHISVQLAKLAADQTMDPVLALEKVSRRAALPSYTASDWRAWECSHGLGRDLQLKCHAYRSQSAGVTIVLCS